jgi:hypothetical protein
VDRTFVAIVAAVGFLVCFQFVWTNYPSADSFTDSVMFLAATVIAGIIFLEVRHRFRGKIEVPVET